MKAYHQWNSKPQIISHHLKPFGVKPIQKSKNRQTFSDIKPESIDLRVPNLDRKVGFRHSQPPFRFQVANSNRLKATRKKLFLTFRSFWDKVVKQKQ